MTTNTPATDMDFDALANAVALGDANTVTQMLLASYGSDASDQAYEFASGMDNRLFWHDVQRLLRLESQSDEPASSLNPDVGCGFHIG